MSQQAADEYKASLEELDSNSKVQINALTMLAEDNSEFAADIASCIENQLKNAPRARKLPILYLIDSICKNFPTSKYVELFTQNIVSNFCKTFEMSDEQVRRSLHKLRITWDVSKTFPQKKLIAIDERVHAMDPNWPVLNKNSNGTSSNNNNINISNSQNNNVSVINDNMNNIQSTNNANSNQRNNSNINKNKRNNQRGPRQKKIKNDAVIKNDGCIVVQPTLLLDPNITSITPQPIQPDPSLTNVTPIYVNPTQILISEQQPQPQPQPQLQPLPPLPQILAPIEQTPQTRPNTILESLYGGKQCSNCSLRFEDHEKYGIHLDWHFRQNQKNDTLFARRQWYYPLNLWVQFRDTYEENQENVSEDVGSYIPIDDGEIPTAPASIDDLKNTCPVCQEAFEKFWAEEDEEWRLRNAKAHNEKTYHPLCLVDMLRRESDQKVIT